MNSFGNVVFLLPPTERKLARRIENLRKKIISAEYAVLFNNKKNSPSRYSGLQIPNTLRIMEDKTEIFVLL